MRKLYLDNGNKQFKFADTATEIHLNAFDGGSSATLTADAKVKIKNDSGYLLGVSASITDNHAVITSGQLAQLPVGSYLIELWDTVNGGTAIYPSDGFLALQINENVTGLSGGLVSSITVDDFIKQFSDLSQQLKQEVSEAVSNGLKGDKGNDGLSAYQIAVINGYHGSQSDWLASLVGATGLKGEKGNPGKDFKIVKTFPSIAEMNGADFSDGDFTMIASDVNDPDDGKLYVWNGTGFAYIADLSGSQGIKGDTGKTGDKGDPGEQGEQGLSAYQVAVNAGFSGSVNEWLASLVGATGTVDNAGLTTAPAFVGLQTQVDNSAVGTNLLTNSNFSSGLGHWKLNLGTNADCKAAVTTDSDGDTCVHITGTGNACGLYLSQVSFDENQVTTGSILVKGTGALNVVGFKGVPSSNFGTISTKSYSKVGSTMQATPGTNIFCIYFNSVNNVIDVYIKLTKLELGSNPTDWSVNPTEILTQSDYAKIKAAIVALGGSLS